MAVIFMGATSGAIHAATGPDHWLSLGPIALGRRYRAFRVGLQWGVGHGVGTLILAAPVLWLFSLAKLDVLASWGERLSGLGLLIAALLPAFKSKATADDRLPGARANPIFVGLFHGVTGASALLIWVPMLASSSHLTQACYLLAFAIGSALSMAALTTIIGCIGFGRSQIGSKPWLPTVFQVTSAVVGAYWLVCG